LLLRIFDRLHVPDAVWSETIEAGRVRAADALALGSIQRHTLLGTKVTRFVRKHRLLDLHAGERECLFLCQQIGVPLLLTDDLAVRRAAKSLGLTPVGSLGVVVKAYRLGYVSLAKAEHLIADLYDVSTLFVTRAIVELAIEQLRERSGGTQ
jgi:predicted nucleic acid-binding protein